MEVLGPLLWALFVTCLILVLAYWFTRYVAGHMMTGALGRGKHITVLEQVSVGKEQRLLLVRIGNRTYFLSATFRTWVNFRKRKPLVGKSRQVRPVS